MSVAVAAPFFRPRLEPDERVSLRHLDAYLGGYDRYLVGPHGVEAPADLPVERFDARWFASHRRYSELMLSPLYERFRAYEYVLVHQLDSLVLRDELREWCERGHDFVGAPWVRRDRADRPFLAGVGNGGFSLRRVQAFLDVLRVASPHACAPGSPRGTPRPSRDGSPSASRMRATPSAQGWGPATGTRTSSGRSRRPASCPASTFLGPRWPWRSRSRRTRASASS